MLPKLERDTIISLMRREVIPAIGCTEPIAVALCVAKATEIAGALPNKIDVNLSINVLKNAMGVGIPGTGMVGLPIAIALGALIGRSKYELEVLRDITPESVELGKKYISERRISIDSNSETTEKLYIKVEVETDEHKAVVVIASKHTNFVYIELDGKVILDKAAEKTETTKSENIELTLRKVYDFAMTTPISDIEFIVESRRLNMNAAKASLEGEFGHCVGRTLQKKQGDGVLSNDIFSTMIIYTSAACDARMAGAMIPVMSNSGSGNQGIAATIPVVVYAEQTNASQQEVIRALTLSHLSVIYIKQSLGRLSALCGCVVAATGSSCGIVHLMGGGYDQVASAVKNMIANLTGMICDGAKPDCSMKLASGVSTATLSAILAMEGRCAKPIEGIIDEDVDICIQNLTAIAHEGMKSTDDVVLKIMLNKEL